MSYWCSSQLLLQECQIDAAVTLQKMFRPALSVVSPRPLFLGAYHPKVNLHAPVYCPSSLHAYTMDDLKHWVMKQVQNLQHGSKVLSDHVALFSHDHLLGTTTSVTVHPPYPSYPGPDPVDAHTSPFWTKVKAVVGGQDLLGVPVHVAGKPIEVADGELEDMGFQTINMYNIKLLREVALKARLSSASQVPMYLSRVVPLFFWGSLECPVCEPTVCLFCMECVNAWLDSDTFRKTSLRGMIAPKDSAELRRAGVASTSLRCCAASRGSPTTAHE